MKRMEAVFARDKELALKTGGAKKYALLGTGRNELVFQDEHQIRSLLQNPHRLAHCYSAFLVNVDACFRAKPPVLFPPRAVWEDVEFNQLATKAVV